MYKGKRLSKEERKAEIMQSASKIIMEKGFANTTMEDIIAGTTLSKGGVYHYYKNTIEIFRDIMLEGIDYRKKIIQENLVKCENGFELEFVAKQMVEKIIDNNPYMPLYVEFLIQKRRNVKLESVFEELKEKTIEKFDEINMENSFFSKNHMNFVTDFLNSMILGSDILEARENFIMNKHILEKLVIALLTNIKEEYDGSL